MKCLLCSQLYSMAKIPVTTSIFSGKVHIAIAEDDFLKRRAAVPETLISYLDTQSLSLNNNWTNVIGATQNIQGSKDLLTWGIASVLSTLFDNNITNMVNSSELVSNAARLCNRFFHELLLSSVVSLSAFNLEEISGVQITVQNRVIIVAGIGIALTILLGLSFLLYIFLLYYTRPKRRPLGIAADPSTVINLTRLLVNQYTNFVYMQKLHQYTREVMKQTLQTNKYYIQTETLHDVGNCQGLEKGMYCELPTSCFSAGNTYIFGLAIKKSKNSASSIWEPRVIRLTVLFALLTLLAGLLVGILILHRIAVGGALHQTAFVYQVNTSVLGDYWISFSPFAFIPTIIAVLTGLWWGAMDEALRSLEPYISMSSSPKNIASAVGLSYHSSY